MAYRFTKRLIDIAASALGLIVLLPFLPLIALAIKLDSNGSVFFTQKRLGRFGELFTIYKLRTMAQNAPEILNADGSKFVGKNDARLTKLGQFLRDFSVDELPQLFNVLIGDMSFVGPRPDQPGPHLHEEIFRRKRLMRPGLTCLSSVSGRNSIPWMERVSLDVEYVENASLRLDYTILWKTVGIVLRREGIYAADTPQVS